MGFAHKYLLADGLIEVVRHCFRQEHLTELIGTTYSWQDCVMSGLAIFGFKCLSLLQFDKMASSVPMMRRNLRTLYKVAIAPSDTCLRERLDRVSPQQLRCPFKTVFAHLQRGKVLESYRYLQGHHIISLDGTGQYRSKQVSCKNVVIPLASEPIIKRDGATKNDCGTPRGVCVTGGESPHGKAVPAASWIEL